MITVAQTPTPLAPTLDARGHLGTLKQRPAHATTESLREAFGLHYNVEYRPPMKTKIVNGQAVAFMPMLNKWGKTPCLMPTAVFPDGTEHEMDNSVGVGYTNNDEMTKMFAIVKDLEDADIATAKYGGPMEGDAQAAVQMQLREDTLVNGDRYANWIMFRTSFDGTCKFTVSIGATRYWCDNMRQIIADERVLSRSHRRLAANWSAASVRDELLAITDRTREYWAALEQMHETSVHSSHYTAFLTGVFGQAPDANDPKFHEKGSFNSRQFDANMTRWWNDTNEFNETYNSLANRDVRGTIAGLYEARLQMLQYEETNDGKSKNGAFRAITGNTTVVEKQNKAFSLSRRLMTAGV